MPDNYTFVVPSAHAAIMGEALMELPAKKSFAVIMSLERQLQEQNFAAEQKAVQDKVAEANGAAIRLAADQQLNLGPTDPVPEPPTVTVTEVVEPPAPQAEAAD